MKPHLLYSALVLKDPSEDLAENPKGGHVAAFQLKTNLTRKRTTKSAAINQDLFINSADFFGLTSLTVRSPEVFWSQPSMIN